MLLRSNLTFTGLGGGNGETSRSWVPAVDVWETENELVYAFDLSGIPEDTISVEFEDGALTVSAGRERKQEFSEENLYRFERRFGHLHARAIAPLPEGGLRGRLRRSRLAATPQTPPGRGGRAGGRAR